MSGKTIAGIILFAVLFLDYIIVLLQTCKIVRNIKKYEGRVEGIIVGIRNEYYYERLFTKVNDYYLTFQYTVDEITYVDEFPSGYRNHGYKIGQIIELHYDLEDPRKYVPNEAQFWKKAVKGWVMIIILTAMLLLLGWYLEFRKTL